MAKTQKKILCLLAVFCLCFGLLSVNSPKAAAETQGQVKTRYYAQYGTYISSEAKTTVYNTAEIFQVYNQGNGKIAYLQFDLTEFLSTEEPINRAELVLYLSQEPTDNSLQLRYATNNVWNDQAERKDEFCWDPSTTRSAINNSVIFDKKYDITGAKEGPVRFDILEFINYVKENYGTEQKSYTVDYVVTLVVRSGGSRAVNFYSQNAEEHLRPYIEFNYVPTEPTYDIVLNVGENGGIYSNREIVEAEGIKKLVIAEGGDAIIKVIPDAGYEIDTFTIDGEDALDLLNNYQLTLSEVQKNYVISATFKQTTANNIIYPLSDMALVLDNSKIDKTELRVKTATNVGSTTRVAYLNSISAITIFKRAHY